MKVCREAARGRCYDTRQCGAFALVEASVDSYLGAFMNRISIPGFIHLKQLLYVYTMVIL